MSVPSVFPLTSGNVFKHAAVSVIKVGRDHVPDLDPDPIDQSLADLNDHMRGRHSMSLAELRSRLDHPRSHRVRGYLPSDVVLLGIMLQWFGPSPWPDNPYGLLFEFGHGASLVVWRGLLYDRAEDGSLVYRPDRGDE